MGVKKNSHRITLRSRSECARASPSAALLRSSNSSLPATPFFLFHVFVFVRLLFFGERDFSLCLTLWGFFLRGRGGHVKFSSVILCFLFVFFFFKIVFFCL